MEKTNSNKKISTLEAAILSFGLGLRGLMGGGVLGYAITNNQRNLDAEAEKARIEHFQTKHEVMQGSGHTTEPYIIIGNERFRLEDSTYKPACTENGRRRCPYDDRFPPRIEGNDGGK